MSLSKTLMLGGLLALACTSGCGFNPVHGDQESQRALQNTVQIQAPQTVEERAFVLVLEDILGTPHSDAPYKLSYDVTIVETGLAVTGSNDITRFNVTGVVTYEFTGKGRTKKGTAQSFTSYSASGSTIATLAAERDARNRLMEILAERVATRLQAEALQE